MNASMCDHMLEAYLYTLPKVPCPKMPVKRSV